MTNKNHRSVNIFEPAEKSWITFRGLCGLFVGFSVLVAAILAAGKVNISIGAASIFLSISAILLGGRKYILPVSGLLLFGIASALTLDVFGLLPSAAARGAFLSNVAAITSFVFCFICAIATWALASSQNGARKRTETATKNVSLKPMETLTPPVLVVDLSPLGRVTGLTGRSDWFRGAEIGAVFDRDFKTATGQPLLEGLNELKDGVTVLARRDVDDHGEVWALLEMGSGGSLSPLQDHDVKTAVAERTLFFAGLGHDLKSPLNSVIGFAEMMDDQILGPMPDAYKDYAGMIRDGGQTLLRLVEDMLGYARAEAGRFEFELETVDLAASGESVLRQSQGAATRANVKLQFRATGEVLAHTDADAVRRIWDNLVSNAIKYSEPGGLVRLSAKAREEMVSLSVTDHGAGMSGEDLARIAEPFKQGHNSKGHSGSGLGLAMVKRLAETLGGQVIIRTALGQGTQVTVLLPSAETKALADRAAE